MPSIILTARRTLAGALLIAGCSSDEPSAPLIRGTTVAILGAPDDGVLVMERPLQLRAVVRSEDGEELQSIPITWRTSDGSLATVSADGVVTGVNLGDVEVRAVAGGASSVQALSVRAGIGVPDRRNGPAMTSTALNGLVRVTVPAGAVSPGTMLHVRSAVDPLASERLVRASAVELGPSGERFDESVTLSLAYPGDVPPAERPYLRMHSLRDGSWDRLQSSVVELGEGRVRAQITRVGTYALLRRSAPARLEVTAGNLQQGSPGAIVATTPRVTVQDQGAEPVEGAVVRFAIAGGGGTIVGADTGVSAEDGMAALAGAWRLGDSPGENSLTASVVGSDVSVVRFTAQAVESPRIGLSADEINFDVTQGGTPAPRVLQVTNEGGQSLTGLSLGAVSYSGAGAGWLLPSLSRSVAPATLTIAIASSTLPVNDYVARLTLHSSLPGVHPETLVVRVAVRNGSIASLAVTRQMSGAISGRVATTQPRVELRSANGAVNITSAAVTAQLMSGSGTLIGTTTVSAVNGVATFTDLRIDGGGTHRLTFSTGGLQVNGSNFTVTQLLAALEVVVQPGDAVEDQAFGTQPVIRLLDDAGLVMPIIKLVTAVVSSGDGELRGTLGVLAVDGIARFTNLRIEDGEGLHVLQFRTTSPTRTVHSLPFMVED